MAVLFPKAERNGTSLYLHMPSPLSLSQTDNVGKIKDFHIYFPCSGETKRRCASARSQSQRIGLPSIQWVAWLAPLRTSFLGTLHWLHEVLQA